MKPTIEEIKKAAAPYQDSLDFMVVAVRTQSRPFALGPMDHVSTVRHEDTMTGEFLFEEELDGICATDIDAPEIRWHSCERKPLDCCYYGEHIAIVCGDDYSVGDDLGEVIIKDPVCMHIFC